jgi:hypothetical protein
VFTFASNVDGITIHVHEWAPAGPPRGIVQISHGMGEHAARYAHLAETLAGAGFAVCADDHRGHGQSMASTPGDLGKGGWDALVDDMVQLSGLVRDRHPGLPLVLVGHSLGSFASQQYILDHSGAQEMQDKLREQEKALQQDSDVIKKLRETEVQLRQERRKLEDDRDALQAEKERMRDEIRKQERDEAERKNQERYEAELRQKDEVHAVEMRELEEKLKRVNTQLDEARRKGATGSRQEEGFTQQDLFAEELRRRFTGDEITVTPRGMAGADIAQVVRLHGHDCGVILWECKRAANWSGTWIGKLADDVARAGAELGIIISEELPSGMTSSGLVDGIWVTDYPHAPTLAAGLREAVMTAWRHKLANVGRDDTAAKVYDYIATGGFADRYAAAERALDAQLETLRKEKRYYAQSWAQREQQIDKTRANLTGMVSDLIRVGAELPSTAIAQLPAADVAVLPKVEVPALSSAHD